LFGLQLGVELPVLFDFVGNTGFDVLPPQEVVDQVFFFARIRKKEVYM
jgi:hypothetical protein